MKKLLLIISVLALTITLTGCTKGDPFEEMEGFSLLETDTISLTHSNGIAETIVYSYTFDNEYFVFEKDESLQNTVHYDFTNINNFEDISEDFKAFLDTFDIIVEDMVVVDYGSTVELSNGAANGDFNYEEVDVIGDTKDVYAYIITDDGVRLRLTYTMFNTADGVYYIPSYIIIETIDLHKAVSYTFLDPNNDYFGSNAVEIEYQTYSVALPPKTGVLLQFETDSEDDTFDLGYFKRVLSTDETYSGLIDICQIEDEEDCISREYYKLDAQVYNSTIREVKDFYVENFGGTYYYEDFLFISDGIAFKISGFEEVQVNGDNGEIITVVNMVVEIDE